MNTALIIAIDGLIGTTIHLIQAFVDASDESEAEEMQHLLDLAQRLRDTRAAVLAYKPRDVT